MSGQIVDASLIAAPRQRNTQDEKKAIRDGRIPDDWKDKPAKLRQKDRDARWAVKYTKAKPREDGSTPPVDKIRRGKPIETAQPRSMVELIEASTCISRIKE